MNTANHLSSDDLYLFALQLLPDAAMKDAASHLRECAECRAQLGEIQGGLAPAPVEARPQLVAEPERDEEPRFAQRNSRMFQMDAPEEKPRRFAPIMAWTGWGIAACLAVVAGTQVDQRKMVQEDLAVVTAQLSQSSAQIQHAKLVSDTLRDSSAMNVSLHVPLNAKGVPKADPEGHATYQPITGSLVFVADHLDPLAPAKTYELWLLPATAGDAPIPAGLFKPDLNGNATVVLPTLPKGVTAKGFGVTVENDGGSKTPTAPIVLAGL